MSIGTTFLNRLIEITQENYNSQLRLKVYFENAKAIAFYDKNGFKKIGTEITDIGNNYRILDDVMEKVL